MPGNPAYTDGSAVYGSTQLNITPAGGGTAWTAMCDGAFSVSTTTRRVEQRNIYGEPTGAFAIKEATTGRCTIYLPADKQAKPGDTFTAPDATGTKVWIITEAEVVYASDDYRKQNITFVEKLSS